MRRPTATAVLLVAAAIARATAIALVLPEDGLDPRSLVLALDVLVPAAIAAMDLRGSRAAPPAALAHGALGAGTLVANGLLVLAGTTTLSATFAVFLTASTLSMLAAATVIGRWQDHGAPAAGPGPLPARVLGVLGALALAGVLVTSDLAVMGAVPVPGGVLPGPVGVATTIELRRLPLLVGALLPMAWAATRADALHLQAVAVVLGARAVLEAVADAALLGLGAPIWPTAAGVGATVLLLGVVPVAAQVTSSRA